MTRVTESQPIGMDELRAMARERFGDPATREAIRSLVERLVRK